MFCQECGAKNEDDSIYCQECGTKLDKSTSIRIPEIQNLQQGYDQPQIIPVTPKKSVSRRIKLLIGIFVLFGLVIAGTFSYANYIYSPGKEAERYFLNIMNGKWDAAYDEFDIKESQFISKKYFLQSKEKQDAVAYNTYKIGRPNYDSEAFSADVTISYRIKGDNENSELTVHLNKQKRKNFLFFNSWKVDPATHIQKDFFIQVPNNSFVTFDGTILDSKYNSGQDDYYTYYEIPALFQGEYDIKVSQENMDTVEAKVSTYDGEYYLDQMYLNEEAQSAILASAQEALQAFYTAGLSRQDFSAVADYFSEDPTAREEAQTHYYNFMSKLMNDDGEGMTQIDLNNFTGSINYSVEDGLLNVSVVLNYNYTVTYNYLDWWSNLSSSFSSYNGSNSFVYIYENGKWVIKSSDYDVVFY